MVVADLKMPEMDGLAFLEKALQTERRISAKRFTVHPSRSAGLCSEASRGSLGRRHRSGRALRRSLFACDHSCAGRTSTFALAVIAARHGLSDAPFDFPPRLVAGGFRRVGGAA